MDGSGHIYGQMLSFLKKRDVVLTSKRLAILEAVSRELVIEDVEEFWINLRTHTNISWATVHVFLGMLSNYGLLERQKKGNRSTKFAVAEKLVNHVTAQESGNKN